MSGSRMQPTLRESWSNARANVRLEPRSTPASSDVIVIDDDDMGSDDLADECLLAAANELESRAASAAAGSIRSSVQTELQNAAAPALLEAAAPPDGPREAADRSVVETARCSTSTIWSFTGGAAAAAGAGVPAKSGAARPGAGLAYARSGRLAGEQAEQPCAPRHIPGFDVDAGQTWLYPTNNPVRDYQFNIVQKALFQNTLVVLPTGLGKTFIAAVVMYNFHRWYPDDKVVFMAPTRPLVAQQMEACYNVVGIAQEDTTEMTGAMHQTSRAKAWQEKKIIFLTPQVLANDLAAGLCSPSRIKCLVFDEAHKAQGNHSYCQVMRDMSQPGCPFRVLALSATPGSNIHAIQNVVRNLQIAHIDIRTDESFDVAPYIQRRTVEKVVVKLGQDIGDVQAAYTPILEACVKRLQRQRVLCNRPVSSISKFAILQARNDFRQLPWSQFPNYQRGAIEGDFRLGITLFHGYELLVQHGLRSFKHYFDGVISGETNKGMRGQLMRNEELCALLRKLDGVLEPIGPDMVVGHPKLDQLEKIVIEHFKQFEAENKSTRVIIFSQYRDSVAQIATMFERHQPLIKVMRFVGQSSAGKTSKAFTQKDQLAVMKAFRNGGYNTLVSTCIGEEGLDIAEVDLIVCFDCSKSPLRMTQRMGRTGRKRKGRVVILVSEGKEEEVYDQCRFSRNAVAKVLQSGSRQLQFFDRSPRMVPLGLQPVAKRMHFDIAPRPHQPSQAAHPSKPKGRKKAARTGPASDVCVKGIGICPPPQPVLSSNSAVPPAAAGSKHHRHFNDASGDVASTTELGFDNLELSWRDAFVAKSAKAGEPSSVTGKDWFACASFVPTLFDRRRELLPEYDRGDRDTLRPFSRRALELPQRMWHSFRGPTSGGSEGENGHNDRGSGSDEHSNGGSSVDEGDDPDRTFLPSLDELLAPTVRACGHSHCSRIDSILLVFNKELSYRVAAACLPALPAENRKRRSCRRRTSEASRRSQVLGVKGCVLGDIATKTVGPGQSLHVGGAACGVTTVGSLVLTDEAAAWRASQAGGRDHAGGKLGDCAVRRTTASCHSAVLSSADGAAQMPVEELAAKAVPAVASSAPRRAGSLSPHRMPTACRQLPIDGGCDSSSNSGDGSSSRRGASAAVAATAAMPNASSDNVVWDDDTGQADADTDKADWSFSECGSDLEAAAAEMEALQAAACRLEASASAAVVGSGVESQLGFTQALGMMDESVPLRSAGRSPVGVGTTARQLSLQSSGRATTAEMSTAASSAAARGGFGNYCSGLLSFAAADSSATARLSPWTPVAAASSSCSTGRPVAVVKPVSSCSNADQAEQLLPSPAHGRMYSNEGCSSAPVDGRPIRSGDRSITQRDRPTTLRAQQSKSIAAESVDISPSSLSFSPPLSSQPAGGSRRLPIPVAHSSPAEPECMESDWSQLNCSALRTTPPSSAARSSRPAAVGVCSSLREPDGTPCRDRRIAAKRRRLACASQSEEHDGVQIASLDAPQAVAGTRACQRWADDTPAAGSPERCLRSHHGVENTYRPTALDDIPEEENDEVVPTLIQMPRVSAVESKAKALKRKAFAAAKHCDLLDEEADVSGSASADEDEAWGDLDGYDESFVDDRLTQRPEPTDEVAMYLRSTANMLGPARGKFHIKATASKDSARACTPCKSSASSNEESEYEMDSFCVADDVESFLSPTSTLLDRSSVSKPRTLPKRRRVRMRQPSDSSGCGGGDIDEGAADGVDGDEASTSRRRRLPDQRWRSPTDAAAYSGKAVGQLADSPVTYAPNRRKPRQCLSSDEDEGNVLAGFKRPPQPLAFRSQLGSSPVARPAAAASSALTQSLAAVGSGKNQSQKDAGRYRESLTAATLKASVSAASGPASILCSAPPLDKNSLTIFASCGESLASKAILEQLRSQPRLQVIVADLEYCDYLLSSRMAVLRMTLQDLLAYSRSGSPDHLTDRMRAASEQYGYCALIVEAHCAGAGSSVSCSCASCSECSSVCKRCHPLIDAVVGFAKAHKATCRAVFSVDQGDTSKVLGRLARQEHAQGHAAYQLDYAAFKTREKNMRHFKKLPGIRCGAAMRLCCYFDSTDALRRSSIGELEAVGKMSRADAEKLYAHLQSSCSG